jgi:calcineurin-like phosphoesterase family protein
MNKVLKIKQTDDQKVYWVSDTHLNHNPKWEVPLWEARGHKSSQEHTDFIINKINEIVRPNDILIHVGDFCLNTEEHECNEFLERIQCQNIYLLWGNHNNPLWKIYQREISKKYLELDDGFSNGTLINDIEVYPFRYKSIIFLGNYAEIIVDGHYFSVCHYPIYVWNYVKHGANMICGHSHYGLPFSQADNLNAKILDVGWDGYAKPLSTQEVLDIMDKKTIFETGDHHQNSSL